MGVNAGYSLAVSGRDQQKASTRASILRAAAQEFAERGYAGTSIARIAAAMGRPKSALGYHQFASKQSIAEAIVEAQYSNWVGLLELAEKTTAPGLERLLSVLLTAASDAMSDVAGTATVRLLLEDRTAPIPIPRPPFSWRGYAVQQIGTAVELGQLPSGTDDAEAAGMILNASYGLFAAETHKLQESSTEHALRHLWGCLLYGFGAGSSPELLAGVRLLH